MEILGHLIIDFYSRYQAAVRINTKLGNMELFGDLALLCTFNFAQMVRLKGTGIDLEIAKALKHADLTTGSYNLGDYINARDIMIEVPKLVSYSKKGEKGFEAIVYSANKEPKPLLSLTLHPWGFGIFGKEVKYYALQSINVLLSYFSQKYRNNKDILLIFNSAAILCGEEYLQGNVRIGISQGEAAARILLKIFQEDHEIASTSEKLTSSTKECSYCHKEIPADASYCSYCGEKIVGISEPFGSSNTTIEQDFEVLWPGLSSSSPELLEWFKCNWIIQLYKFIEVMNSSLSVTVNLESVNGKFKKWAEDVLTKLLFAGYISESEKLELLKSSDTRIRVTGLVVYILGVELGISLANRKEFFRYVDMSIVPIYDWFAAPIEFLYFVKAISEKDLFEIKRSVLFEEKDWVVIFNAGIEECQKVRGLIPDNEWSYFRGLLKNSYEQYKSVCNRLAKTYEDQISSHYCPVCESDSYRITEGCKNCGYRNELIGLLPAFTKKAELEDNPLYRKMMLDRIKNAETEASREFVIHKLTSTSKEGGIFKHPCPKCKNKDYFIFNGCSKCGYKNSWADKVIVAVASGQTYVPIDMMVMDEMIVRDEL